MRMSAVAIAFALSVLTSAGFAGDAVRTESAGLRFSVPPAWARVPASSEMRQAQFRIPRAGSDAEDGELVLFHFGNGQGGGVQENVDRWLGQLKQPDGSSTKEKSVTVVRTVNGLKVTSVDAAGDYAGMGEKGSKPGYRLLGAVVEGTGGPWFFKAVGPQATLDAAKSGFDALVASLEAHQ